MLLRYVDAGSVTHPMSLLGVDQLVVAQDGHPTVHAESEVVEAVESGATADTIVTMPSGPERRVTLFEAGQHLDNDGQTDADPGHVALGGMMTFLDTDAPPPTDDLVGPVPAHVTASPNPSNGLGDVTVTADLSDRRTGGSNVTAAEIVVDDAVDTAVGSGIPMGPADRFGGVDVDGVTATHPGRARGRRLVHPRHGAGAGRAVVPVGRQARRLRPWPGLRLQLGCRRLGRPPAAEDRSLHPGRRREPLPRQRHREARGDRDR